MPGMDRPEQRQIVVAVPGGHGFALFGQGLDTALFQQEFPDLAPERGRRFLALAPSQHLAEDADQRFLDSPVLIMQGLQLLLGRGLRSPDRGAASSRSVRRDSACGPGAAGRAAACAVCPAGRCRGDRPPPAPRLRRRTGGALCGRCLPAAGPGSIRPVSQSSRSIQSLMVFGVAGPGVCLRRLKSVVTLFGGLASRASSIALCSAVRRCRHPVVDPRMDLGAQPVDQPIKRAERRQIDRCRLQRFDRAIDEVGGIAHRFGGFRAWCR